jgi:hypothetical protein
MTSAWFLSAFCIYLLFGLYAWAVGGALFGVRGSESVFSLPWLGYGMALGMLQLAHLFAPMDRSFAVSFLLVTSALALAILWSRALWHGLNFRRVISKWPRLLPLAVICFVVFIPVFNACTKAATHYDVGLYYLQEIRWMETFPIVRGLGNLMLNLGFNQNAFLITSVLDSLLPDRVALWLVGGLLPWLGLTQSVYALARLLLVHQALRSRLEVAYAISLPAWIYTLLWNNIPSGSPDTTASCVMIHFFLVFAALIMSVDATERARLFGDLLVVAATCLCLKLNTLGLAAGVCLIAGLFLLLEKNVSCFWHPRALYGAALAACLLGCWVHRGILLSGYPLFPSRALAVPVAWQVKASEVDRCREDTVFWARIPWGDREVALHGFWIKPWIQRISAMEIQFTWPIGIGVVAAGGLSLLSWLEVRLRRGTYFLMLLCAPLFLDAIFWFLTAPEPRYLGSATWLFASTPILALLATEESLARPAALTNLYLTAVPLAGMIVQTAWVWSGPEPKFPEIPRKEMIEVTNRFNLRYYVPSDGNQSFDNVLPSSNRRLHDVGLLNPAAGIAGGFCPMDERKSQAQHYPRPPISNPAR